MKDPHEHSDMPHESEDVRKRDCRKYKELYGKHFTKDLCEWAVERMENRNGTTHHYNLDDNRITLSLSFWSTSYPTRY